MESIGIELVLKQNLAAQLKTILPMLTKMNSQFTAINKSLGQMETFQNNANRGFQRMANQMQAVNAQSKGLQTINQHVKGVGTAATGATRQVSLLGASLGGLMRTLGPLVGIYKIMQGVGAVGTSALDFEKEAKSLQQIGLSADFQKRLRAKTLELGSNGQFAMSGADFMHTFKETRLSSKSDEDALKNLPFIGTMDMKLRQVDKGLTGQANLLPRYFEKFSAFTEAKQHEVMNDLLKVIQASGGTVTPANLLMQLNRSGTSVVGSDPLKEMTEQALSLKESGAGSGGKGGGGGGVGRGGSGRQAIDRIINLGVMPPAMVTMMTRGGMFDEWPTSGKKKGGHQFDLTDASGHHVLHNGGRGGLGSGNLSTSEVKSLLVSKRPPWMIQDANDPYQIALDFLAGADQLGGNKLKGSFLETKAAHIAHFSKRPVNEQKYLYGQIMGGAKMTGIDFNMERVIGSYRQQHDIFAKKVGEQAGLGSSGQLSIADRWDKLISAFVTFGNALGDNKDVIATLNHGIDALSAGIKLLNDNVGPIAAWLSGNAAPEKMLMDAGSSIGGTIGKGISATDPYNRQADKRSGSYAKSGRDWAADFRAHHKMLMDPPGGRQHLGNVSVVPPPPPVTALVDPTLARAFNDTSRYDPSSLRMPPGATPKSTTIQNNIYLDGKKIAEHTAHHVEKQQLKSARKMSYGGSRAGGSYTDQYHNAGSGQ